MEHHAQPRMDHAVRRAEHAQTFIFGWTAADLATLSVTVNGNIITAAENWSGEPAVAGTRGTAEVPPIHGIAPARSTPTPQRTGHGRSTRNLGTVNTGLTLPWITSTPVTIAPATATFTRGESLGYFTITQSANNVRITAADASSHTGVTPSFTVSNAVADADGDGMPDAWETAHGLNPLVADALLDTDGDGMSNLAEYLAGTDPQSSASNFRITSVTSPAAGQFAVTWPAVAGKLYRISTSADLSTWQPSQGVFLATTTGLRTVTIDIAGATQLFLRVEIAPAQ